MNKNIIMAATFLVSCVSLSAVNVAEAKSLKEAFLEGQPYLDVRFRYEHIDQAGLADKAHAATIRTRLGYKTAEYMEMFSGVIEFENVTQVGNDNYNDTLNGKTSRPVVADIENTEINQLFLKYTGVPDTWMKLGRQVITLDGHRFVGHVGWRQNNQTFDAVTIQNKSIEDTVIKYGYINGVNRIFGDDSPVGDFDSDSHYINVSNKSLPIGKVTGYGYFFDFENEAPALSSRTIGLSLDGKKPVNDEVSVKYHLEYAYQSDYADNTANYDADYYHIAPAVIWKGITATIGYEVLGSDNGVSFKTPLATLHKFNGWADVFLVTPAAGLEDFYLDLTYKVKGQEGDLSFLNGLLVKFQYHDFSAESGGADYGTEYGIYIKQPINEYAYAELKYADYNADGFATDREKVTIGLGLKF